MIGASASDDDLLAKARAGDRAALEALLERHQDQVYRFGMKMCRDPEDAKDVLQETLLTMARGVRERFGADVGLSVTGIAGPDGGTADKPVGTVCFSVKLARGATRTRTIVLPGNRSDIRERSTTVAMHLIRGALQRSPLE